MEHLELEEALQAVGDLLAAEQTSEAVVVVGGASLSLLGLVPRATRDVDVIARTARAGPGSGEHAERAELIPPDPLPEPLVRAISTVARDFNLPPDWMNTDVALQWHAGLPPGLAENVTWRRYGNLHVGLVGGQALLALKLFAAVDGAPGGVHFQDLLALRPTAEALSRAADWVRSQDASPVFARMVGEVLGVALARLGRQQDTPDNEPDPE